LGWVQVQRNEVDKGRLYDKDPNAIKKIKIKLTMNDIQT